MGCGGRVHCVAGTATKVAKPAKLLDRSRQRDSWAANDGGWPAVILAGECVDRWRSLESALSAHGSFTMIRSPGSEVEVCELAKQLGTCIIVADQRFLERAGGSPHLLGDGLRTLVIAESTDCRLVESSLRNGCWGVLQSAASVRQVRKAILALAEGEFWAPRTVLARVVAALRAQVNRGLTRREREVLELVEAGFRNREIAQKLFVSPETVRWHLRGLYKKLGVRDRLEAALCASRLLSPPSGSSASSSEFFGFRAQPRCPPLRGPAGSTQG